MYMKLNSAIYCVCLLTLYLCGYMCSTASALSLPTTVYQRSQGVWTMEISSPCTPAERGVVHIVNATAEVMHLLHSPSSSSSTLYLESQNETINDVPMSLSGIEPYMIMANKRGIVKENKYAYFVCEDHANYLETVDRPLVAKSLKSTRLREIYGVITDNNVNTCNETLKRDFVIRLIEKPWSGTKLSGDMKQFVQYIEIEIDTNALPDHCKREGSTEGVDRHAEKDGNGNAHADKPKNRRKKGLRKRASHAASDSQRDVSADSTSQFDLSTESGTTAVTARNEAAAEHGYLTIRMTRRKKFVESSKWPISPIWIFAVGMMLVRALGPLISKKLGF